MTEPDSPRDKLTAMIADFIDQMAEEALERKLVIEEPEDVPGHVVLAGREALNAFYDDPPEPEIADDVVRHVYVAMARAKAATLN